MSTELAPGTGEGGGELVADLREHRITFFVPAGTIVSGNVDNQGGALIYGKFTGNIHCREGSLIVARGAEFCGNAEADNIYVEGTVRSISAQPHTPSMLKGRHLVALSEHALGRAELHARGFAIHSSKFVANIRYITE